MRPQPRGELLFMRVDGKDKASYAGGNRGSLLTHTLRDGSDYVIVTDYQPSQHNEQTDVVLYKVNAKTAKGQKLAFSPVPNARFTLTHEGEPRLATGARGYRESDRRAMEGTSPLVYEESVAYRDGTTSTIETLKTPLLGANGEVLGVIGICRDIAARKAVRSTNAI